MIDYAPLLITLVDRHNLVSPSLLVPLEVVQIMLMTPKDSQPGTRSLGRLSSPSSARDFIFRVGDINFHVTACVTLTHKLILLSAL